MRGIRGMRGEGPPGHAWLPARVMSVLPRGHTPSGAARAAAKTPATSTARDGPYLLVRLRVRPERHRAQSCAIALRSPAPERSSDNYLIFLVLSLILSYLISPIRDKIISLISLILDKIRDKILLSYLISPTLNGIHQIFTHRSQTNCLPSWATSRRHGRRGSDARAAAAVVSLRGVHA